MSSKNSDHKPEFIAPSDEPKVHIILLDELGRKVPLAPPIERVLGLQWGRFHAKFGRLPTPDEPLFFDPDAEEPRQLRGQAFEDTFIAVAREAGVPESEIYALQKTDLLLMLSLTDIEINDEHKDAWDAAVNQFEELN